MLKRILKAVKDVLSKMGKGFEGGSKAESRHF